MKKFFLCCLLTLGMFSAFADSKADIQFRQFVEMNRNNPGNPAGMTVSSDEKYRIMYLVMPIAVNRSSITPEVEKQMKRGAIAGVKNEKKDIEIIKDLQITMVATFITTDGYPISFSVSYKEF